MSGPQINRVGTYIREGNQLLLEHEWAGGIRITEKVNDARWKEVGGFASVEGDLVRHVTPPANTSLNILPSPQYQQAMAKAEHEKQIERLKLKAASPMRKPFEQQDLAGLALFDQGAAPTLF